MKILIPSALFVLMSTLGFAQNILEALALKHDLIGAYVEGEARPTDTLIDLAHGYYEAFSASEEGHKTIIRQAAIFKNQDGSTLLGISTTSWDFQCYVYATNFYEIPKQKDSIKTIPHDDLLPNLDIKELLSDSTVLSVLRKYLPAIQEHYLGADATLEEVLAEVYDIIYLMPHKGTSLLATLKVCDYIPTNAVHISPSDWAIIENTSGSIELPYDKTQKIFRRR